MIRRRIRFYGFVQGVGFRFRARHAAALFGCTGFVRNEEDGTTAYKEVELKETVDYGETDLRSIIEGDRKYNQNESFASQGYSQQEFQGEELVEVDEQDNGEEPLDIDFDENEDMSED